MVFQSLAVWQSSHLAPQAALVHVVLAVAAVAAQRGLAPALGRGVALGAVDLDVLVEKFEVGELVVEGLLVEGGGLEGAALVIGVAGAAGLLLLVTLAVPAGAGAHVLAHLLVAGDAQAVLCIAVEARVAGLALVLGS